MTAWQTVTLTMSGLGVIAVTLLRLRRRYLVITVSGRSMQPTYDDGERVLVRRADIAAVRPGAVVIFASTPENLWEASNAAMGGSPASAREFPRPNLRQWAIKRAIAIPGDQVPRKRCPALQAVRELTVPIGHLVVIGDSPSHSYDSRQFGYVPPGNLVGIVVRRLSKASAHRR